MTLSTFLHVQSLRDENKSGPYRRGARATVDVSPGYGDRGLSRSTGGGPKPTLETQEPLSGPNVIAGQKEAGSNSTTLCFAIVHPSRAGGEGVPGGVLQYGADLGFKGQSQDGGETEVCRREIPRGRDLHGSLTIRP